MIRSDSPGQDPGLSGLPPNHGMKYVHMFPLLFNAIMYEDFPGVDIVDWVYLENGVMIYIIFLYFLYEIINMHGQ